MLVRVWQCADRADPIAATGAGSATTMSRPSPRGVYGVGGVTDVSFAIVMGGLFVILTGWVEGLCGCY
jgi:hypothetical protein